MEKVVVFNKSNLKFIKNVSGYPAPKELFCNSPEEAHDFGTSDKAYNWSDGSGFSSLAVLKVIDVNPCLKD